MPLFSITKRQLTPVGQENFATEKQLQAMVEANLGPVFSCRLVASEFSTGAQHLGRIDTLALSEDNNPVILEYKKVESSELINQSLFYLAWLSDHRGDFEVAAQRALGPKVNVDWSAVRVICIAPNFRRYDLHAVQVMGADIELWTYRLFKNNSIFFEEVFQRSLTAADTGTSTKGHGPRLTAGKKAAITRAQGVYTFEQHLVNKPQPVKDLALAVDEFITRLDSAIQVAPKKHYVAYKTTKNIVCMEVQRRQVVLFLKLDPRIHKGPNGISRNVAPIGHFGTGDLEVTVKSAADLEAAKPFIELAYREVGS